MPANASQITNPTVDTSVVRFIRTRMLVTHEERAICVISGPWGIGKTTAVEAFVQMNSKSCVVVKVEPGSTKRGASPVLVLQQTVEALRPHIGRSPRATLSNAYWSLRQMLYNSLQELAQTSEAGDQANRPPQFSIVFDEAQYLSSEAIEMLRFWNDPDRTAAPFPIGLIFVGNSEFALEEKVGGQSVLSGAVRSRALFIETLGYEDVSDEDIATFLMSRGAYDSEAIALLLSHFRQRRVRRDFRNVTRLDEALRRRAKAITISAGIVSSVLN